MTTRLDGKFYTGEVDDKYGRAYTIRMTTDKQLHLSFDPASISFAGFMLEDERDRYLAEWTDTELTTVRSLIHRLYESDNLKHRIKLSGQISRLKDAVQRRAGIKDT